MVVYGLISVIILFGSYLWGRSEQTRKRESKYLLFVVIVLSLLEGLRAYTVGTDTASYIESFRSNNFERYEFLIKYLHVLLRNISANGTFYLLVMAFLTNGLILLAVYRDSESPAMSVFLFVFMLFFFVSFNAMRQAIAYALVLNAFVSAKNKKLLSYLFFWISSIFFHSSALVGGGYILLFFIRDKKNFSGVRKTVVILFTLLLAFIVLNSFDSLTNFVLKILPEYEIYIYGDYSRFAQMKGGISRIIIYTAIFISFIFVTKDSLEKKMYLFPLIICIIISLCAYKIAYIERFMYYFDITVILSIPYMLRHSVFDKKSIAIIKILIAVCVVCYFFWNFSDGFMRVTNYKFFWE